MSALIFGRRRIAAALSISQSTLKEWEADPTNPTARYLSRVGKGRGRIATTERLLSQLRDALVAPADRMAR